MKIFQLNSNYWPTNKLSNNAIYSHVGSLSDQLVGKKHDVTLFGSRKSRTKANIRFSCNGNLGDTEISERLKKHYINLLISKCYQQALRDKADVVHSHFTLNASYFANISEIPTVVSVHSPIDESIKPILMEFKDVPYISFSYAQRKQMPELNWYANIYHGVDTNLFSYVEETGDYKYFLYLGRITNDKGVHLAIEAANRAGKRLLIAGKTYKDEGYWQEMVEPFIDGENIRYVGQKNLYEKIELLQNAEALVFPSQCEEVFGYSMIEAMSCGTPTIGWNNGSISEVVKDSVSGFVVDSVDQMVDRMQSIKDISRAHCRKRAERFFSIEKMVSGYENVYQRVVKDFQ